LVIVQSQQPDEFFTAKQQERLQELMARWRAAREAGASLTLAEQTELDALVDAEVQAAGRRAGALCG
jgi:response regulator of citrate/malate metabolism